MSKINSNNRLWPWPRPWMSRRRRRDPKDNIILNKHFCFIQIPKTSSTNFLKNCKKKRKGKLVKLLPCYRHEGLLYIEQFIDNTNLPIYTIVRNPFLHIHSFFFHKLRGNNIKFDPSMSIIKNFEKFCKREYNNVHLRQYDYLKSNKNLNVKFFKLEEGVSKINDYILKKHNIDLKLENTHHNKNPKKDTNTDVKSFFRNKDIVDLIIEKRYKEFKFFNYSININDI